MTDVRKTNTPLHTQGFAVEYYPGYVNRKAHPHSLNVVLLSCILRGNGRHIIDDQLFEEHGNSVAVTHYGQRHDIVTDEVGMDVINLYLDLQRHPLPDLPRELSEVLPLFLPLHPRFANRLNRVVRLEFDDLRPLGDLLFAIQNEQASNQPGHEEAARLYLQLFLMQCCRRALKNGFARERPPRASPLARLERLRLYLDRRYVEAHTLSSLAERAGVSRTYLCRAFKRYTGKSVFDYLIERRIQAAMMRLRGSTDKILTVAFESGFSDLAYFNRRFRRTVGMTPTQYRGQFQKGRRYLTAPPRQRPKDANSVAGWHKVCQRESRKRGDLRITGLARDLLTSSPTSGGWRHELRVRADRWGLSLMALVGLLPSACGGVAGDDDTANAAGQSGSGGTTATGGTSVTAGSAGAGGTSGTAGVVVSRECEAPVFDAQSGITTCENGARYRTEVGTGCNYVPPEGSAGDGGAAGAASGGTGGSGATVGCDPSQCTERPYGYCAPRPPLGPQCDYGCLTDEDCGGGVCSCPGEGFGVCLPSDCRSNADCEPGFRCAEANNLCGSSSFHCEVAADQCRLDQECGGVGGGSSSSLCEWFGEYRVCFTGACGRPFLVDEQPRLAPSTNTGTWYEAGQARPCLDQLTAAERRTLAAHYTRLGLMEHASIAAFARFALQLLGLGAPAELVSACNSAIRDETAHALSCFSLATSYADQPVGPGPLQLGDCMPAFDLESVLRLVIAEGCVGETVAALEAAEAAERATDPAAKSALQTISIDETRHAELAWRFVRWALETSAGKLDDVARAAFGEQLLAATNALPSLRTESERLADHGMLSEAEQLEVRANALRHVVAPCARALLGARPVGVPEVRAFEAARDSGKLLGMEA